MAIPITQKRTSRATRRCPRIPGHCRSQPVKNWRLLPASRGEAQHVAPYERSVPRPRHDLRRREHELDDALAGAVGALAVDVNAMAGELVDYTERLAQARARSREGIIFALAKLAESRDDDTGKHLERIGRYVDVLGEALVASGFDRRADTVGALRLVWNSPGAGNRSPLAAP